MNTVVIRITRDWVFLVSSTWEPDGFSASLWGDYLGIQKMLVREGLALGIQTLIARFIVLLLGKSTVVRLDPRNRRFKDRRPFCNGKIGANITMWYSSNPVFVKLTYIAFRGRVVPSDFQVRLISQLASMHDYRRFHFDVSKLPTEQTNFCSPAASANNTGILFCANVRRPTIRVDFLDREFW